MANNWTREQKKAIDTRNCSVLVSAAAGSGKTAVLVERILQKVMDKENPVNIDTMVIVTFTTAAAAEMKERIRIAIDAAAAAEPENEHLQKQKILIHHANISTIHAFCTKIIKNHFDKIDLDPSSRVAKTGEIDLLRKEAMDELLENYYKMETEGELNGSFLDIVEKFSSGKKDKEIEDMIFKIYDFSMSYPFPNKWLDKCENAYNCGSVEELENMPWMSDLKEDRANLLNYAASLIDKAMEMIKEPDGPYMYAELIEEYQSNIQKLILCKDYVSAYDLLKNFNAGRLSSKKDEAVSPYLREKVKEIKEECVKIIKLIKEKYYFQKPEILQKDIVNMKDNIHTITTLVKDFRKVFSEKKKEKNVYDFSDLEHMALEILVDEEGFPTVAAKEYADYFEEIMIDEYQDSNYVQEILLNSVSKRYKGIENVFMVGDAKQSIYRFRLARPEIFTNKYNLFTPAFLEDNEESKADKIRIDLFKNFRSRKEVLHSVNYIFEKIMKKELGGIEYDEMAALHPGAQYEEQEDIKANNTDLILFSKKEIETMPADEFEAELIAAKIKSYISDIDGLLITDKKTGELRKCKYNDIAILVRNNTSVAKACIKVFKRENIPLVTAVKEGYFESEEIDTVLNLLKIIDNPLSDIPFAAVLKSPIVGLTENELSQIRIGENDKSFYEAASLYNGENEELKNKLISFNELLLEFRKIVNIIPLHEFLWLILEKTGYGDYICAMPNNEQRNANMEMLINKAIDFEATSYIGIFQFVNYIEQIKSYNIEEGQASIVNENDNTVKLMTIHKSKGLEFPVVFAAGLGKDFNTTDEKSAFILHPELGIGVNAVDLNTRQKRKTLIKQVLSRKLHLENMAEEMRVLYVALTRAKEKLVLTAGVNSVESALSKAVLANDKNNIDIINLSFAKSFIEWILAALKYHTDMKEVLDNILGVRETYFFKTQWDCSLNVSIYNEEKLLEDKLIFNIVEEERKIEFEQYLSNTKASKKLDEMFNYEYPYKESLLLPVKVSVSELKKTDYEAALNLDSYELLNVFGDEDENIQSSKEDEIIYPSFIKEKKEEITGADRGDLYHGIFEHLDYFRMDSYEEISKQIDEMFKKGLLESKMQKYVNKKTIQKFAESSIGNRMKAAAQKNDLWREQPFVLEISANLIKETAKENETVLVQGIIDAFFIEEEELVLVDYKTDKVSDESVLIKRYKKQMDYYKQALTRLFEKNVKECIIYSVSLNKEIKV